MKETGNKKHILRRIFIISAIVTAVSVAAVIGVTALLPVPSMVLSSIGLMTAGVSALLGAGVGINLLYTNHQEKVNKKNSIKYLQKIAQANKDKTIDYSREQRVKLVKKLAKANLKLCNLLGCPLAGKFHSISGLSEKDTEHLNVIDNLELLKDVNSSAKEESKLNKKIETKKYSTKKVVASYGNVQPWTKTYDEFLDGVRIYDRRTEIGCLTPETTRQFKDLVKNIDPTDEVGGKVVLSFLNSDAKVKKTYARVEDIKYLDRVKDLMINDVYTACIGKTQKEQSVMFPFTVSVETIDKNTTKVNKNQETIEIRSAEDLKKLVGNAPEKSN